METTILKLLNDYSGMSRHKYSSLLLAAIVLPAFTAVGQIAGAAPAKSTTTKPLAPATSVTPYAVRYIDFATESTNRVEANIPAITALAETIAKRHLAGGAIGFVGGYYEGSGMTSELEGRSGGLVNIGFDRVWTKTRTPEQKANDMAIAAWDNGPWPGDADLAKIKKLKEAGTFIIGFGPKQAPELAERIALCDAWLDTGLKQRNVLNVPTHFDGFAIRRMVPIGSGNLVVSMMNGWALTGEIVAALTRQGKMPTLWKSYMYPDGREWADKYFQKMQFHDDFKVEPIPAGKLAKEYLAAIRANLKGFSATQLPAVRKAADLVIDELANFRQTFVATSSHAPPTFVGKFEDKMWATGTEINNAEEYRKRTPDGALILRLGYTGQNPEELAASKLKNQRVIWVSTQNPNADRAIPAGLPNFIDMGWAYGDAAVAIDGYPIKILPPSGIMQIVAYESINTEVLSRVAQRLSDTPLGPRTPVPSQRIQ